MNRVYRVVVTPNAASDIAHAFAWYQERNPRAADAWIGGLRAMILGLETMPEAHPVTPESAAFDAEIRRALYGRGMRWRIYFTVQGETVQVLHVRHARRSDWRP